jgi:hypothetical protein
MRAEITWRRNGVIRKEVEIDVVEVTAEMDGMVENEQGGWITRREIVT